MKYYSILQVTGRLVVDIELSPLEAEAVLRCQQEMGSFKYEGRNTQPTAPAPTASLLTVLSQRKIDDNEFGKIFYAPLAFDQKPTVEYRAGEYPPRVLAVTELCGVIFNQGTSF